MKVRLNYVSNSSSSSFVVLGVVEGYLKDEPLLDFINNEYMMIGDWLSEGVDVIDVNANTYPWLKEHKNIVEERFYDERIIRILRSSEDEINIDTKLLVNLSEQVIIKTMQADQHSSIELSDLEDYYGK